MDDLTRAYLSTARKHQQTALNAQLCPDTDNETNWQESAVCSQTDPDSFFPEKGGSTREAKKVCRTCDVRPSYLEHALERDERFGIWGGLSEPERRKLTQRAAA